MKSSMWLTALLLLSGSVAPALAVSGEREQPLPVLHAHSRTLDMREGSLWLPGAWTADPRVPLDEYRLPISKASIRFALVSDQDSLTFMLSAGESRDFFVVLDDKDSCRTRVTGVDVRMRSSRPAAANADTLAFELGRDGRPYFTGVIGESRPLRLMFDAGGGDAMLAPRAFKKGARILPRDTVVNVGGGGAVERPIGPAGQMTIGTACWRDMDFIQTDKDFSDADGLVGWRMFDAHVVAFDFVKQHAVVMDSLTMAPEGYHTIPLQWSGGLPVIEVEIDSAGVWLKEILQLDTGANSALRLTAGSAHWPHYERNLAKLGEGQSRGTGPKVRKTRRVQGPILRIAGFELGDVRVDLEEPMPGEEPGMPHLGMGVLGRFDMIIDFRTERVHVRPNGRSAETDAGNGTSGRDPLTAVAMTVFALALGVSGWFGYKRSRAR